MKLDKNMFRNNKENIKAFSCNIYNEGFSSAN